MAQKTNLNVSPYFDDFAENGIGARDQNYYKVLFNPGKPIQARELNTLQSILQDQVESFGSHIFKEGSVVIPGNISYDGQFYAVKLNPQQYGVDISSYLQQFIGKKITGQVSGVTAVVQTIQLPNSEVEYSTIYVKYIDSDSNFEINPFQDNESLYASETVGSITSGTPFATTILTDSTSIASAASIGEGVYFIRGTFVRVPKQTIILDYYDNLPSYRVGLYVNEQIVTAEDDSNLYDNAQGFTNYAAPGADRLKISLTLTKKSLTDFNDINFVELLRVKDGKIQKIDIKSNYSTIRDYLAQRTYDESGDYSVTPFQISLNNSVNDRLGNDGIFFDTEKTNEGNTPSDDLMCIKISPGKSYVRGYDIEKTGVSILDVEKPRTTENVPSASIPFEMGNLITVNNVSGSPKQKQEIFLQDRRKNSTSVAAGSTIGSARVYCFNLTDAAYSNTATNWDLYLYDIQTYTEIVLNQSVSSTEVPKTTFIKGKSSGASGYAVSAGNGTTIRLSQTSGSFSVGEKILINGSEIYPRTIASIKVFGPQDIRSIHQPTSISGFTTPFISDTQLDKINRPELITISANSGSISTATVAFPATFTGIRSDTIIRYQRVGLLTETYNRVVSVSPALDSITLEAVSSVTGVCDGSLPTSQFSGNYSLGSTKIKNEDKGFLYAELPNTNISSVNLSSSTIKFIAQTNPGFTHSASNTITVNLTNFDIGVNSNTAKFDSFDEERYSIFYTDGTVERLTADKVSLNLDSTQVTFSNISTASKTISCINATFIKNGIQSKTKQFNRSKSINVIYSKNTQSGTGINTSINDGLIFNNYYGLRVQDEEISLNYPDIYKIICVYESLNTDNPVVDSITFNSIVNVDTNAIIGENIIGSISNTVARIVSKPSTNTLGIVYLNNDRFVSNELVTFEESNIKTNIVSTTVGSYRNITSKFILDGGQNEQYYDYSKLIRKTGESSPSRRLLVIFDHYTVPTNDNGDIFTVNSYSQERFASDIPSIGKFNVRASDTLDFRPRVSNFSSITSSPFDFSSRSFSSEPKIIVSPNESSLIGYDFYLGRIDKLYIDKFGTFTVLQGVPSTSPKEPISPDNVMELATITLPPYLFNTNNALIRLVDNKRYTMRDIGKIEDRVKNLELTTSLSLLELSTQTLQIQDANGLTRFKTGFFVDDFKNSNLIDIDLSTVKVDTDNGEMRPLTPSDSINFKLVGASDVSDEDLDTDSNYGLFDSNVQKTGDVVTLKYDSISWIEQNFATRVENVNPFNVISYSGTISLNPSSDSWVRTIRLDDTFIDKKNRVRVKLKKLFKIREQQLGRKLTEQEKKQISKNRASGIVSDIDEKLINTITLDTGEEIYMRSRNTGFVATNLKPLTRLYQFLDGNSGVDFIPKLIEISSKSNLQDYGSSDAFVVGEKVTGWITSPSGLYIPAIQFRVAKSNHKEGPYNDPTVVYENNPYLSSETIPENYSASSKTLNVDIDSLCSEAQGIYSGYLTIGMKLIGETSGSVAYVKDLRLVSDINGFLSGAFFLKDPNTTPPPAVRIATGSKVYKLSSSSSNETPVLGSQLISSAETTYKSEGTWENVQNIFSRTTTVLYNDPLAQSFTVGGTSESTDSNPSDEDSNGVFLTAVDLFFNKKDSNNAPLTVEVRTMELGTPTRTVLGNPVILQPKDISVSPNASVPTKVTFDYPIYLQPNLEYAIVLLAPQSDQYEVWIAQMGEKTIETTNLPDSQAVRYSTQFSIGSLFKSQNGSIWTANQYQDMKFKLYKAKFISNSGSVLLHNPTLTETKVETNPITTLSKKVKIGITTVTSSDMIQLLTVGRKISESTKTYNYGYIVGTGSSVSSVGITTAGTNYSNGSVDTYNITGNGSGLKLNITTTNGSITGVAVSALNPGNGYSVGDAVGIVTSSVSPAAGSGAVITINSIGNTIDTLYLDNVQGKQFTVGSQLRYYNNSGSPVSLGNTTITSAPASGGVDSGNYFKVNHFNHGMYHTTNKLEIKDVKSSVEPTYLVQSLGKSSVTISVASTSNFAIFEGMPVNGTNLGYLKIGNEIISYSSVGSGIINVNSRAIDSTKASDHDLNTLVYKYELGGVSLRRINTINNISDQGIDIDSYYVQFDRTSATGLDRSNDNSPYPELSFDSSLSCGGDDVKATKNILFNSITPHISLLNPGTLTSISGQMRTVSGTSVSGTEVPFLDQGYEPVELGVENTLNTTRIVCSQSNENEYLSNLLRNKSFTMKVDLSTTDSNLSPMIFWKESSAELSSNRLNSPIQDYSKDNRVNSLFDDPHAAVYISNSVLLTQPATSLKVLLSAYRHSSSDFRILYNLIRPDSSEVEQSFELFPGYNNLTLDNNQDGYLDIINSSNDSGLPDTFVPPSLSDQFLEYEYTANNLGSFTGYTIKIVMSGTDQSNPPRFRNLRSIALA